MTTMTAPTAPAAQAGASLPPVPWRKLAWVTWRQHRLALAGDAALLGAACLVMLVNGLAMRSSLRSLGLTACLPVTAPSCATALQLFQHEYTAWGSVLPSVLLALPALIGVFTGGPLLAREFEAGTFRFAWTQGAGRTRLVTAKLALLAVLVAAGGSLFSLMFSWWYQPLFAQGASLITPTDFVLSGTAFAAWTLAAFATAALAGLLIRRTVPAMAAALAATAALFGATALYLRAHYQAALIIKGGEAFPARFWGIHDWFTGPGGKPVSYKQISRLTGAFWPSSTPSRKAGTTQQPVTTRSPRLRYGSCSASTATRTGRPTSQKAGSGPSSSSRAAGCSSWPCCSAPPPSGWSVATQHERRRARPSSRAGACRGCVLPRRA